MEQKQCNICGRPGSPPFVSQLEDGTWVEYCDSCRQGWENCRTCAHCNIRCRFQTDPNPLPLYIPDKIKIGPIIQTINALNPERMAITCVDCPCYQNNICQMMSVQTCPNHKIKLIPFDYST